MKELIEKLRHDRHDPLRIEAADALERLTQPVDVVPFGYLCDWGDDSYGLTRQTFYYGEPGSGTEDDWNECPKVHKNLPLHSAETVARLQQERDEAVAWGEERRQVNMELADRNMTLKDQVKLLRDALKGSIVVLNRLRTSKETLFSHAQARDGAMVHIHAAVTSIEEALAATEPKEKI